MTASQTKMLEQSLKKILQTDARIAQWALIRVYQNQSEYEQEGGQSAEVNGEGFTKIDAEILSSLSKFLLARGFLTNKQMRVVHRGLPKYWRQVAEGLSPDELQRVLAGDVPVNSVAARDTVSKSAGTQTIQESVSTGHWQ